MKISSLTPSPAAGVLRLVTQKDDANSRDEPEERGQQQSRDESANREKSAFSDKELAEAVEKAVGSFADDAQARASGLSVIAEGTGPGLKVVLKDASGSVVRQFTGQEFLELRKGASKDSRARGKILDQKY